MAKEVVKIAKKNGEINTARKIERTEPAGRAPWLRNRYTTRYYPGSHFSHNLQTKQNILSN